MPKPAILFVDDEVIVLDSLKTQLRKALGTEYNYEMAQDAEEALEIIDDLKEKKVSVLIVSDWLMPGMKGDEFLLRVHQIFPETVKILLTGQADREAIARLYKEANLHKCIFKPWSEDELLETIKSGLEKL